MGVTTPATTLFLAIYRGPITPFISRWGAPPCSNFTLPKPKNLDPRTWE